MKPFINILCGVLFFVTINCSSTNDFSGAFKKTSGNCKNNYIILKKVQGFGDKYYLVKLYKDSKLLVKDSEFLGVIKGDKIYVEDGTIVITKKSLIVQVREKKCIYERYFK